MQDDDPGASVPEMRLEIQADVRQVSTARLFIASAARTFGSSDDDVEDARLATSEAVTDAMDGLGDDGRILIRAAWSDGGMRVEVTSSGSRAAASADADEARLRSAVISSLFPEAVIAQESVSFTVRGPTS